MAKLCACLGRCRRGGSRLGVLRRGRREADARHCINDSFDLSTFNCENYPTPLLTHHDIHISYNHTPHIHHHHQLLLRLRKPQHRDTNPHLLVRPAAACGGVAEFIPIFFRLLSYTRLLVYNTILHFELGGGLLEVCLFGGFGWRGRRGRPCGGGLGSASEEGKLGCFFVECSGFGYP